MSSFPLARRETTVKKTEVAPGPGQYHIPSTLRTGAPEINGHVLTATDIEGLLDVEEQKTLKKAIRAHPRHGSHMSEDEIARGIWQLTHTKLQAAGDDEALANLPPPPRVRTRGMKAKSCRTGAPLRLGDHDTRGAWLWLKPNEYPDATLTTSRTVQPEPGAYSISFAAVEERAPVAKVGKEQRFRGNDVIGESPGPKYALPHPEVQSVHETRQAPSFGLHFQGDMARVVAENRRRQNMSIVGPGSYDTTNAGIRWGKSDHGAPRATIGPPILPGRVKSSPRDGEDDMDNVRSQSAPSNPHFGISKRFPDAQHQPYISRRHTQGCLGAASPGPCYFPPQDSIAFTYGRTAPAQGSATARATEDSTGVIPAAVGTTSVTIPRPVTQSLPSTLARTLTTSHNRPMQGLPPAHGKLDRSGWLHARNTKARPVTMEPSLANEVKREIVTSHCTPGPIYNAPSDFRVSLREIGQMRVACRLRNSQVRVRARMEEEGRREKMREQRDRERKLAVVEKLRKEDIEFRPFGDMGG